MTFNIYKNKKKAFIFDRDGVLIKNYGYIYDYKKIKWLKGSIKAINFLNKKKIKVIIATNQSGIARGYFTEKQLSVFHYFIKIFLKKKSAKIDAIYYCPFYKNGLIKKYAKDSFLRKPNPGMILRALRDFNLKTENCFMIGDSRSDYLAAKKANVNFEYKKKCNLFDQVQSIYNKYFI
jgi:D-glycero-D-manno-heptose 1,7-bisphosphate phosphatase